MTFLDLLTYLPHLPDPHRTITLLRVEYAQPTVGGPMKRIERTTTVRLTVVGAALVAASAAGMTAFASTASADDVGDGQNACNVSEICLNRDNPAGSYQRDFYNGGNDTGYWFDVRVFGGTTNQPVHDAASAIENRDTACTVIMVDYYPGTSNIRNQGSFAGRSSSWVGVGSGLNDNNDAHWRCRLNGT